MPGHNLTVKAIFSDAPKSSNAGAIAGGVISSVALVVLILLVVFFTIILRKHRNEETSDMCLFEERVISRFVEQSAEDSRFASMQLEGVERTSEHTLSLQKWLQL